MSAKLILGQGRPIYDDEKEHKYILKIDVDFKLDERWLNIWKQSRKTMLEGIGLKVNEIIIHPSSKRGFHAWIHIEAVSEIPPTDLNMLQFLVGDDPGRCIINHARITRGIDWDRGNKLFSKVLWRAPIDEKCKKCRKHKLVMKLAKEFQETRGGE